MRVRRPSGTAYVEASSHEREAKRATGLEPAPGAWKAPMQPITPRPQGADYRFASRVPQVGECALYGVRPRDSGRAETPGRGDGSRSEMPSSADKSALAHARRPAALAALVIALAAAVAGHAASEPAEGATGD